MLLIRKSMLGTLWVPWWPPKRFISSLFFDRYFRRAFDTILAPSWLYFGSKMGARRVPNSIWTRFPKNVPNSSNFCSIWVAQNTISGSILGAFWVAWWLRKRFISNLLFERYFRHVFDTILVPFLHGFGCIFVAFSAPLARPAVCSKIAPLWYENLIFSIPARLKWRAKRTLCRRPSWDAFGRPKNGGFGAILASKWLWKWLLESLRNGNCTTRP